MHHRAVSVAEVDRVPRVIPVVLVVAVDGGGGVGGCGVCSAAVVDVHVRSGRHDEAAFLQERGARREVGGLENILVTPVPFGVLVCVVQGPAGNVDLLTADVADSHELLVPIGAGVCAARVVAVRTYPDLADVAGVGRRAGATCARREPGNEGSDRDGGDPLLHERMPFR